MARQGGVLGLVSARNGLVIAVPAAAAGIVGRLVTNENAPVISAARSAQVLRGEVAPEDMTEVVAGRNGGDKNLAAEAANKINPNLNPDIQVAPDAAFQEKKTTTRRTSKRAAAVPANADISDLVGDDADERVKL